MKVRVWTSGELTTQLVEGPAIGWAVDERGNLTVSVLDANGNDLCWDRMFAPGMWRMVEVVEQPSAEVIAAIKERAERKVLARDVRPRGFGR